MKKQYRINWEEHYTGIIEANSREEARQMWEEDTDIVKRKNSEITMIDLYEE